MPNNITQRRKEEAKTQRSCFSIWPCASASWCYLNLSSRPVLSAQRALPSASSARSPTLPPTAQRNRRSPPARRPSNLKPAPLGSGGQRRTTGRPGACRISRGSQQPGAVNRRKHETDLQALAQLPTDHRSQEPIRDGHQLEPTSPQADEGYSQPPNLVGAFDLQVPQQMWMTASPRLHSVKHSLRSSPSGYP